MAFNEQSSPSCKFAFTFDAASSSSSPLQGLKGFTGEVAVVVAGSPIRAELRDKNSCPTSRATDAVVGVSPCSSPCKQQRLNSATTTTTFSCQHRLQQQRQHLSDPIHPLSAGSLQCLPWLRRPCELLRAQIFTESFFLPHPAPPAIPPRQQSRSPAVNDRPSQPATATRKRSAH